MPEGAETPADGSEKPRRRTTNRRRRPAATAEEPGTASGSAAADVAAAAPDERSLNQWLSEVSTRPHRVEVFDRWWNFKQPTGGRAAVWDRLCGPDIHGALTVMLVDPGEADEFLAAAIEWVPPDVVDEFWERFGKALFGLGEA